MNFRPHDQDEPELNLIPLIDVLIILLIFLVMTTTFAQQRLLGFHLPEAGTAVAATQNHRITLAIDAQGHYRLDGKALSLETREGISDALRVAAGTQKDPIIVIEADRQSTHQALVTALDALSQRGFQRISFATLPLTPH